MESGYGMEYMSGMGGMGMSGMAAKKADPELDRHRIRLKWRLVSVEKGLTGLSQVATADPEKGQVSQVVEAFTKVMAATDPPEQEATPGATLRVEPFTVETLKEQLRAAVAPLEALTQALAPPPAAEPAVSDEPVPDTPVAVPAVPDAVAPAEPAPAPSEPAPTPTAPPPSEPAPAPSTPAAPEPPANP
jgi:hypothetical protein